MFKNLVFKLAITFSLIIFAIKLNPFVKTLFLVLTFLLYTCLQFLSMRKVLQANYHLFLELFG